MNYFTSMINLSNENFNYAVWRFYPGYDEIWLESNGKAKFYQKLIDERNKLDTHSKK